MKPRQKGAVMFPFILGALLVAVHGNMTQEDIVFEER
jgi:hypothetical protein